MYDVLIVGADSDLELSRWLELRKAHRELVPVEQFTDRNPFTRESNVQPAPHSAEAVDQGIVFGRFWWDSGRLLCPLEFPENGDRLRALAASIASDLRSTVGIVDDYDLELRSLEALAMASAWALSPAKVRTVPDLSSEDAFSAATEPS